MSQKRPLILPQNLTHRFYQTFGIYDFLIHLHSVSKHYLNCVDVLNFNFSAFLTLDKSRKIIRKKEDQFVVEMIDKVEKGVKVFMDKDPDQNDLYRITYAELQKLIQIFDTRKSQFLYFQKAVLNIEAALNLGQKDKILNEQTITKMKSKMDEFQERLILFIAGYQRRTNIHLSVKLRSKFFTQILKQQQTTIQPSLNSQYLSDNYTAQNLQKTNEKVRLQARSKTPLIKKIGEASFHTQKMENYKNQIMHLKNKYYKLNCKTDIGRQIRQNNGSFLKKKLIKTQPSQFCAQPDVQNTNNLTKEEENNASEMKFSIRFTQERKKSKINTSFSIFDKSTHNASFFVKNTNNQRQGQDQSNFNNSKYNISEKTIAHSAANILRKKSSLLKNSLKNGEVYLSKKSNNSVYRQTNFAFEAQRKSNQKRVSTAKPRQSARKNTSHLTYQIRTSQTKGNISQDNNQQEITHVTFTQNNEQAVIRNNQEPKKRSHFYPEQEIDEEPRLINGGYRKTKKGNRRKGFSKKHIDVENDNQISYVPTVEDANRRSSCSDWNETSKQQRPYNRNSFFRSSGYTQKKSVMKSGKTKFNNMNKKLGRKDSKYLSSQTVIDSFPTQKTIRNKALQRDRTKRCLRQHQMAITVKDCFSLYQQISAQTKVDEKSLDPNQLLMLMRQKYDWKYQWRQEEEDTEEQQNSFGGRKFRIMQTDFSDDNERKARWTKGCSGFGEMEFAQIVSRKLNELGQKDMQGERFSWSDQIECVKC